MRKKALMAIVFAGGIVSTQLPVVAENNAEPTGSVISQIVSDSQVKPEIRACTLLNLAIRYLAGDSKTDIATRFGASSSRASLYYFMNRREEFFTSWVQRVAQQSSASDKAKTPDIPGAKEATDEAIKQLAQSSNKFYRLNLYFVAMHLYQKTGNTKGQKECKSIIDAAIKECEGYSPVDVAQVKATTSVLDSMACLLLPVSIPVYQGQGVATVKEYSSGVFEESEKLKLRALAIADRLPETEHVRRKAHRDMALWYAALGKQDLANQQKQELFKLIGTSDDKLLYPQSGGCGSQVWWEVKAHVRSYDCGMG